MAADTVAADVVVLSAVVKDRFAPIARELKGMCRARPLALAGAGATADLAVALDVQCLNDDPATAAQAFSRRFIRRG